MTFSGLMQLPAFWFGAVVFMLSQWGNFSELSSGSRNAVIGRSALLQEIKPRDLTSAQSFAIALLAFLGISFLGYLLLCLLPSGILLGWFTLGGGGTPQPLPNESYYPLFISAGLVGLTQPVPGLGKLANLQREVFHQWIGIPSRVVGVSVHFSAQLLGHASTDNRMTDVLDKLLSDVWIVQIGDFADTAFYSDHIHRMKLDRDVEIAQVKSGSLREKKFIIQELVLAACVSSVRRNGGASLPKLAKALGVVMPVLPPTKASALTGGLLFTCILSIVLYSILPLDQIREAAHAASGASSPLFWPHTPYESAQFIFSNVIPIVLSTSIILLAINFEKTSKNYPSYPIYDIFNKYALTLLFVLFVVILFDLLQAFYDVGVFEKRFSGTLSTFIASRLPLFALHSICSVLCAFAIIVFIVRGGFGTSLRKTALQAGLVILIAAISSYVYIVVRIQLQFTGPAKPLADFKLLIIVLNMLSALFAFVLALLASRQIYKRLAEGNEPAPATDSTEPNFVHN